MKRLTFLLTACALATGMQAQAPVFEVNTTKLGTPIPSTMYGIFFEDINYGADGGLYGELIKNRSFEFPQHFMGWKTFGNLTLKDDGPFERNPHYVHLTTCDNPNRRTGLQNEGFLGIGYHKDAEYRFSVWARVPEGGKATLQLCLTDPATMQERQQYLGEAKVVVDSQDWKKYEVVIKCADTVAKGNFRLMLQQDSQPVDLEHISLFPVDTYKGDTNGMRKDLAESLEQLHPGVFRFPGGCIVEGTELDARYQWKNSIGPVENRPLNENRWHFTFDYRFFPDYYQSYGLGFYEYFRLSEQLGAEPLPVISVGLACQFQSHSEVEVGEELQPYIDDVLDLIEFANGDPATNKWAKIRADMGHPAPFNLKYVAIGNEQWGETYPLHLKPFMDQVRKKYPNIKIIGSSGPYPEGQDFDYLWPEMRKLNVDLVDEHFYRPETWFLSQGNRYDSYSRKGPKIFAGEYACHGEGKKWNHFNAALMESAFMTNLERNADIVEMATYAPLFAHVEGWQWRPDAIWFDNLSKFNTCSYYVQQLYSLNKGSHVLPLTMAGKPVAGNEDQYGLFASSVWDEEANAVIIKVTNTSDQAQDIALNLKGFSKEQHKATVTTLHADNPVAENSIAAPEEIVPETKSLQVSGSQAIVNLPAKTFAVYKIWK